MFGRRVSKLHPQVGAVGAVDELTAALGLARSLSGHQRVTALIAARQHELIAVMGELAVADADRERYALAGYARVTAEAVAALTAETKALEVELGTRFTGWATPGAETSPCAAAIDLARAVCRRAERAGIEARPANPEVLRHLNRLSDFLWLLARYETRMHQVNPTPEGKTRTTDSTD
jgi:cob(I)alamin adenosyltransferase